MDLYLLDTSTRTRGGTCSNLPYPRLHVISDPFIGTLLAPQGSSTVRMSSTSAPQEEDPCRQTFQQSRAAWSLTKKTIAMTSFGLPCTSTPLGLLENENILEHRRWGAEEGAAIAERGDLVTVFLFLHLRPLSAFAVAVEGLFRPSRPSSQLTATTFNILLRYGE